MILLNENQKIAVQVQTDRLREEITRMTGFDCYIDVRFTQTKNNNGLSLWEFIKKVKMLCAAEYEIEVENLEGKIRKRGFVESRQIAMWLLSKHTGMTLREIGLQFKGRDHSTVIHAKETVADLMLTDKTFKQRVEFLDGIVSKLTLESDKKWLKITSPENN